MQGLRVRPLWSSSGFPATAAPSVPCGASAVWNNYDCKAPDSRKCSTQIHPGSPRCPERSRVMSGRIQPTFDAVVLISSLVAGHWIKPRKAPGQPYRAARRCRKAVVRERAGEIAHCDSPPAPLQSPASRDLRAAPNAVPRVRSLGITRLGRNRTRVRAQ